MSSRRQAPHQVRMITHSTEPFLVDNEITLNSMYLDEVTINNTTEIERMYFEMIMSICRAFNMYSVYESYENNESFDPRDNICRIIIPSQRECDTFSMTILNLYIERVRHSEGKYRIAFVSGLEDGRYNNIDDICSNHFYFTFENHLERIANLRRILHRYYLPFSTVEMRRYQILEEHIRRSNRSNGLKRLNNRRR